MIPYIDKLVVQERPLDKLDRSSGFMHASRCADRVEEVYVEEISYPSQDSSTL